MMKTTLFSMTVLACLLFTTFAAGAYDLQLNGVYYTINANDGTATVVSEGSGIQYTGDVSIPATVSHNGKNYDVTAIDYAAFSGCSQLNSITLVSKLKSLGIFAFSNCKSLKSVTIPNSVESMGHDVFNGCTNLTSVTLGTGLKALPYNAFSGAPIAQLVIPGNVETIGSSAFDGCTHLKSLVLNEGILYI